MQVGEGIAPPSVDKSDVEKCKYCKKPLHPLAKKPGNSVGSGPALRKNIIAKIEDHTWYTGSHSLQAHHLICSEAMDDDKWPVWCAEFGYNIDHKENGVMLPYLLELACQLHAPLHRGGHATGVAEGVPYPDKITTDIKEIGEKIEAGKFCDNPQGLIDELNKYSKRVLGKVDKFSWTITGDGRDYKAGGNGCAGVKSIEDKPKKSCPNSRLHKLTRKGGVSILTPKITPLEIGK